MDEEEPDIQRDASRQISFRPRAWILRKLPEVVLYQIVLMFCTQGRRQRVDHPELIPLAVADSEQDLILDAQIVKLKKMRWLPVLDNPSRCPTR